MANLNRLEMQRRRCSRIPLRSSATMNVSSVRPRMAALEHPNSAVPATLMSTTTPWESRPQQAADENSKQSAAAPYLRSRPARASQELTETNSG